MTDVIQSTMDVLDKIDAQLDGVIDYLDNLTTLINKEIASSGTKAQEVVNEKIEELSQKLTDKLQPIRNKLVATLSSQFQEVKAKVENAIAPISAFVTIDWASGTVTPNIPVDPAKIAEAAMGIISMLVPTAPIKFAVAMVTQIFPKVSSISDKILGIATYKPEITIPDIVVPPLSVEITPITITDIIGTPEEENNEN